MTYKGLFEKCNTHDELIRTRDTIIAQSSSPCDDSVFSKFVLADIYSAYKQVCKQKGWEE